MITRHSMFYGQSFGFVAEDAGAVVAAMEKWRGSKAGKPGPNTVVLIQNIVNGDYDRDSPRERFLSERGSYGPSANFKRHEGMG